MKNIRINYIVYKQLKSMKKVKITQDVCLDGYLRRGHYELELSSEQYEEFKKLSKEEQEQWITEGNLIIDDYRVNHCEVASDYSIEEL